MPKNNIFCKKSFIALSVLLIALSFVFLGVFSVINKKETVNFSCLVLSTDNGKYYNALNGGHLEVDNKFVGISSVADIAVGTTVTISAVPHAGYAFVGFFNDDLNEPLATDLQYSLLLEKEQTIVAKFAKEVEVSLQVQSPFDNNVSQTITATCFVGQNIELSDIVQAECDESWLEYYAAAMPKPTEENFTSGYTFTQSTITVGAEATTVVVEPSDTEMLGSSSTPSGYSSRDRVLVIYGGENIEEYSAVSTTTHIFNLKEERADCKIYTCSNWSFQYLWNGGFQGFLSTEPKLGYVLDYWQIDFYNMDWYIDNSYDVPVQLLKGWYSDYTDNYLKIYPTSNIAGVSASSVGIMIVKPILEEGYTATFYSDSTNEMEKSTHKKNTSISLPSEPSKEGFIFAGWTTSPDSNIVEWSSGVITLSADTNFYPVWQRNNILTYTYINQNGVRVTVQDDESESINFSAESAQAQKINFLIDQVPNAEFMFNGKKYQFIGFSSDETSFSGIYANTTDISGLKDTVEMYGTAKVLYAVYSTTIYITYNPNGGQGAPAQESTTICKSAGEKEILSQVLQYRLSNKIPTIEDGQFTCWMLDTLKYETGGIATISWDTTFTAKWLIDHTLLGKGTEADPYTISSAREYKRFLAGVNDGRYSKPTQHFKLLKSFEIGYYEPVGIYDYIQKKSFPFMGIFDGNGQTLTLSSTGIWHESNYVGIFGYNNGIIKNLTVNATIIGNTYVGGLCAYNVGNIVNCTSNSVIMANGSYVGGLVGVNNGLIDQCISTSTINATNQKFSLAFGGLVGINLSSATIRNVISSGTINAEHAQWVGGIVGQNHGMLINAKTSVKSTAAYYVGGIAGQNSGGKIFNSYSSGRAYSLNTYAGGVAGYNTGDVQYAYYFLSTASDGKNRIQNAFGVGILGQATPNPNHVDSFTIEGANAGVQLESGGREVDLKWALNLGLEIFSLTDGNLYCSWEDDPDDGYATIFVDGWNIGNGAGTNVLGWTGSGTLSDPYQIGSLADLQLLQEKVALGMTYQGTYFVMTYDITFKDTVAFEWLPIGGADEISSRVFAGIFDGQGHKISDIEINNSSNYQGIFGYNTGIIRNVVLENLNIHGKSYIGGLVGYNTGSVINCTFASGIVSAEESYVGGLVGVNKGLIEKCISSGTTTGLNQEFGIAVGGVTGINLSKGVIRNTIHTGVVEADAYQWLGGIAGQNHGQIINVYNHGSVEGAYYVGGLVGQNGGGKLSNAYSKGAVISHNTFAGGVAGYNSGKISFTYYLTGVAEDGEGKAQKGIGNTTLGSQTADIKNETTVFNDNKTFDQIIINGQTTTELLQALNIGQKYYDSAENDTYCLWANDESNWPSLHTDGDWNGTTPWIFEGKGTKDNPYLISTEEDLYFVSLYVNSGNSYKGCYFKQTENITLSKYAKSWSPIGTYDSKTESSNFFAGIYDGQYKTISGININISANYQGLFGYNNGIIKNISVIDATIFADSYIGGIVGYNTGTIEDCYFNGYIQAAGSFVGGVVGVNGGVVNKCYNLGNVVGVSNASGLAVGGVIGINLSTANAFNIFNNGIVEAEDYQWVGGIVGQNHGILENTFNNGDVTGGNYTGGIVGQNSDGEVSVAYTSGKIVGTAAYVGAVCGFITDGKVLHTFYLNSSCVDDSGEVQNGIGNETIGEKTEDQSGATWRFDKNGAISPVVINNITISNLEIALETGHARLSALYENKYCSWENREDSAYPAICKTKNIPVFWNNYKSNDALIGTGSITDPYIIEELEDLKSFAMYVNSGENFKGKYIRLMADIKYNGSAQNIWAPIGWYDNATGTLNDFAGIFDGNGYTISGLYTNTKKDFQGFFGYISGTVQNLTVKGSIIGGNYVGGIAGYNNGTIIFCKNECAVSGNGDYIGGIAGGNNGKIKNSSNLVQINGKNETSGVAVGGIVGVNLKNAVIDNSFSSGDVSANAYQSVGGIAGENQGEISSTYSSGNITGAYYVGGVVGQNDAGNIINSISYGATIGQDAFVGGVVGFNNEGNIEYTYYLKNKAFDALNTAQNGVGNETVGEITTDLENQYTAFNKDLTITPSDVFGTQTNNLLSALNAFVFENRQNGIIGNAWTTNANGMPIFDFCAQVWNGNKISLYDGGSGTVNDPYRIANANQLAYFANEVANGKTYVNEYFVLTKDIYLNHLFLETATANANLWKPINNFAGNFDGKNFAVHGVFVNTIENNAGLFGQTQGQISNLCVASGFIQGLTNVGGIVGYTSGNLLNCISENMVEAYGSNTGGVVGFSSGMINDCGNSGNISALSENVGGVVGQSTSSVVNCFNKGEVKSQTSCVGGIVGVAVECSVINCFNVGFVYGAQYIGGVVGHNKGVVNNTYNMGCVSGTTEYVGGVVGKNDNLVEASYYLLNSISISDLTQYGIGAAAGTVSKDIYGQTNAFSNYFEMAAVQIGNNLFSNLADALNAWSNNKQEYGNVSLFAWKMGENYPIFEYFWQGGQSSSFSGGDGTKENPYQIATSNDLSLLSKNVANGTTYLNKYFIMTKDIYLNDELFAFDPDTGLVMVSDGVNVAYLGTGIKGSKGNNITFDKTASTPGTWYASKTSQAGTYSGKLNVWSPIGTVAGTGKKYAFAGYFDGDGHAVSGVYLNGSGTSQGLFGIVSGIVKNVGVVNSYIAGDMYISAVVGNCTGTLSNLYSEAVVIAKSSAAGGVCGYASANSNISNAYNNGIVWGNAISGGVGGQILGKVENIYNWGNVYQGTGSGKVLGMVTQNKLGKNIYGWTNTAPDSNSTVVSNDNILEISEELNNTALENGLLQWRIDALGKPSFFSNIVWDGSVASGYEGGTGIESDPYLISNASQLAYFASGANRGSYATIIKDIYLNDETFIFDYDTGLINVSDGLHTAYLGTGVKGDVSGTNTKFDKVASIKGTWYTDTQGTKGSYKGSLNTWTGISNLKTILDGAGHTIYGLYSTSNGLLSTLIDGGIIQNVQVSSGLSVGTNVAGIANSCDGGTIKNCFNLNIILGENIAGIVSATNTTISTSKGQNGYDIYTFNMNTISDNQNAGVLIGVNVGGIVCTAEYLDQISNCINNGNLYATEKAGGIIQKYIGHFQEEDHLFDIIDCHNFGEIVAGTYAGGIAAYIDCGNYYEQKKYIHYGPRIAISNSTNNAAITGTTYVGGIVGYGDKNQSLSFTISNVINFASIVGGNNTGGLAGRLQLVTVTESENKGNVNGLIYTGGLVGYSASAITNCMNLGTISGTKTVGGIAGYVYNAAYSIGQVYNLGEVYGKSIIGGIIGENGGANVSRAYNGGTVTATTSTVGGIVGKSSSGAFDSCFNIAYVYGTYFVGGIVGEQMSTKFANCQYGYGLIFATKSNSMIQGGCGVGSGETPSSDIIEGISKFMQDTLLCVKGDMRILNQDLFFEKVGISSKGGGMYLVENTSERCTFDGAIIAPKDYGILPQEGLNVVMAYKAATEVTVFTNGRGKITNANGWQLDSSAQTANQLIFANNNIGILPQPTDETHTFVGWYKDPECEKSPVTEATIYDFSFTKLYAKWVLSTFTMSINLESGKVPATEGWDISDDGLSATKKVQSAKTIGSLPELYISGYKFEGWFADPACTQRITQYSTLWVNADVQIYPKLTLNTFNITIKLNDNEWVKSGISIQIFKVDSTEIKVFEATNIQDSIFKIDQPFDVGYYRVMASQKVTNLGNMVQFGAIVLVEGSTNFIIDYYSITLTKGDNGINCVYILEENGQLVEVEDIHNNAQIYLRGQSIVVSAVVAEKDGFTWGDWIDGDTGNALRSGQDLTITSIEKPYVFTAQSK